MDSRQPLSLTGVLGGPFPLFHPLSLFSAYSLPVSIIEGVSGLQQPPSFQILR